MNKKIILFLLFILFLSCQINEIQNDWNTFKFNKVQFNNIEEIQDWVDKNIHYVDDKTDYSRDYFKYPSETLDDGKGDCDDMAILIIAIVNYLFNYKCNLVLIKNGNMDHAIIRYKASYYHSTTTGKYNENIDYVYEYEYDEIPYLISTKR